MYENRVQKLHFLGMLSFNTTLSGCTLYSRWLSHSATDAQRDGGLAQRWHSCITFQIRTFRRRCAKTARACCTTAPKIAINLKKTC